MMCNGGVVLHNMDLKWQIIFLLITEINEQLILLGINNELSKLKVAYSTIAP